MKIKTADLTGPALDWAVSKCLGATKIQLYEYNGQDFLRIYLDDGVHAPWEPSCYWNQGGPIIEREGIYLRANDTVTEWAAGALRKNRLDKKPGPLFYAKTPLIAAMRCVVASKLGDEIEIPEELLK